MIMFQKKYDDGEIVEITIKELYDRLSDCYHDVQLIIDCMKDIPGEWIARSSFALYRYIKE